MVDFTTELHIPPPVMNDLTMSDFASLVKYLESRPKK